MFSLMHSYSEIVLCTLQQSSGNGQGFLIYKTGTFLFRNGPQLKVVLEDKKASLQGHTLTGPKPSMAYREKFLTAVVECISERYADLESQPVIASSKIASLRQWPVKMPEGKLRKK